MSQNLGFYDQRLALEWTSSNIASFGGDPSKITIFGDSSGASSVDRLVTAPPDPLPFRAAILHSGQATVSANENAGPPNWKQVVSFVGCNGTTAAAELECMKSVNGSKIHDVVQNLALDFFPVSDNVTQRATPLLEARKHGQSANIPIVIGTNSHEGSLFVSPILSQAMQRNGSISLSAFSEFLSSLVDSANARWVQDSLAAYLAQGPTALFFSVADFVTNLQFQCPTNLVSHANAQANNPTYRYYFNATFPNIQSPALPPSMNITNIGAYHASDIPLVFGTYDAYSTFGNSTSGEVALSRFMQRSWANFAKDPYAPAAPGWRGMNANGTTDIGCLGCTANPTGVSLISEDVDSACSSFYPLYTATRPVS
ncbi:uncharacterized protein ATNIH1004_009231 [Aspergillus tanneri]|uniref:Carboxylic ester hydrolase n=1 Tax=Aspergillus tanneri TaxID=1220188 RepID=A0A5M9MI23_9EURO|nr:uncharacterized protein ATNIH1004_009231 [Aspergillus tanneri]KAA8645020.1 hypothetical protein ATNIH1004_009231 [Aspergillus tanneri]